MVYFSVVLPVYNAEITIVRCVLSVLQQSFSNFELIIVNDGSTDSSLKLLLEIESTDNRIKLITQDNSGVGCARNVGIKMASGKYLAFIDADDYYYRDFLKISFESLINFKTDTIICNSDKEVSNIIVTRLKLKNAIVKNPFKSRNFINEFLEYKYDYSNWNKIYSLEIINREKIRFSEKLTLYEDLLFNLEYLFHAKKISILEGAYYFYYSNPQGLCSSMNSNKLQQFKLLIDLINIKFQNSNYLNDNLTFGILSEYLHLNRNKEINKEQKKKLEHDFKVNNIYFNKVFIPFSIKKLFFNLRFFSLLSFGTWLIWRFKKIF